MVASELQGRQHLKADFDVVQLHLRRDLQELLQEIILSEAVKRGQKHKQRTGEPKDKPGYAGIGDDDEENR